MKRTSIFSINNTGISLNIGATFLQHSNNNVTEIENVETLKDYTMEKTFSWTYNIISSCNNDFHFDCADALIQLFAQKYGDTEMLMQLKQLRQYKWSHVHGILN
jgi:hypothetical protein